MGFSDSEISCIVTKFEPFLLCIDDLVWFTAPHNEEREVFLKCVASQNVKLNNGERPLLYL